MQLSVLGVTQVADECKHAGAPEVDVRACSLADGDAVQARTPFGTTLAGFFPCRNDVFMLSGLCQPARAAWAVHASHTCLRLASQAHMVA
jgi:hypothetical protein